MASGITMHQTLSVFTMGMGLALLVLHCIRKRWLRERYAMLWALITLAMLTIPAMYPIYGFMAAVMGIQDVTSLLFLLSIMSILLLCLQFSLALSAAYGQRKSVAQQVAILEERIVQLEEALQHARKGELELSTWDDQKC